MKEPSWDTNVLKPWVPCVEKWHYCLWRPNLLRTWPYVRLAESLNY